MEHELNLLPCAYQPALSLPVKHLHKLCELLPHGRTLHYAVFNLGQYRVKRYLVALLQAYVAAVAACLAVIWAYELACDRYVVLVGRGHLYAVDQARAPVNAYVRLRPEVAAAVLLRAGHLGVALAPLVPHGLGGLVDCGIHYRAAVHYQAVFLNHGVHERKNPASEILAGEHVAEVAENSGVRDGAYVNSHELPERVAVVYGILKALVAYGKPELEEIHAQYHIKTGGRAAGAVGMVVGLDEGGYVCPGNDGFHLAEEFLPAGRFLLGLGFKVGESEYFVHASNIRFFPRKRQKKIKKQRLPTRQLRWQPSRKGNCLKKSQNTLTPDILLNPH